MLFDLPTREAWWIEAKTISGKDYSRAYLKLHFPDKESAKKQFLRDTSVDEEFEKIEILDACI